ncbi:MAG TPA: GreA/GreB family elongation factor [Novimethylophilus sp.]|uniref:GreA/GreB family elongation factor n=1 Tax=Novimethylophilus sp. TaxID=2137426 RepID=UPI002F426715
MSRAFLNEDKFEQAGDELVERPVSAQPNYVTPAGLRQLQQEAVRLEALRRTLAANKDDPFAIQQKAEVERDLRYYAARLESATMVDPAAQPSDEVRFGAVVGMEDEDGHALEFAIVGEDEADVASNKVSWVSPLAKALIGAHIGDSVKWRRPAGDKELEIIAIRYQV